MNNQDESAVIIDYDPDTQSVSISSYRPVSSPHEVIAAYVSISSAPEVQELIQKTQKSNMFLAVVSTSPEPSDSVSPSSTFLSSSSSPSIPQASTQAVLNSTKATVPAQSTSDTRNKPKVKAKKKYKPVHLKTKPIVTSLPEKFRIRREIKGDPLAELPTLSLNPPPFTPTGRYTAERRAKLHEEHGTEFLTPPELALVDELMCKHNTAFAWNDQEKGRFRPDFFPPIEFAVVDHKPWVQRNIPIPPGLYEEVCQIIKQKIDSGVYEPSNSSYRSRWFCVLKKDGKSLRLVHSLEPLNAVTIQQSGVTPIPKHLAEKFGGRTCGAMFPLYVGSDE